jgi:hypothetical protein
MLLATLPWHLFLNSRAAILKYIGHTSAHIACTREIVELVVDNRCQAHLDRVNAGCSTPTFLPGNLVVARVQVTSNARIN